VSASGPVMTGTATLRVRPDVLARRLGDAIVLVHLHTNRIYELNATGARIFELLREGRTIDQVVQELREEFDANDVDLRGEIDRLIEGVRTEGLADVVGS
jgi:hypothetical protein